MHTFEELSRLFIERFNTDHFPKEPASLYEPNRYFLKLGGKRVRPVLCLMGNELFGDISQDAMHAATAIELFHNFTLIHDDIMDKAPLRRGNETVHQKFGESTALLAGDVMLVAAYEYLNRISPNHSSLIISLFNKTAREVCEGQQLDMDFEKRDNVGYDEYLNMINLKTSVLLAASLKMGTILGGALERNQNLIYEFGRKLGLAFQVQDDYLDAFGDPEKFGKQVGGDIKANKKTFLLIHAFETATPAQKEELHALLNNNSEDKVSQVLNIFKACGVDEWARALKEKYMEQAFDHLEDIAVLTKRKEPLKELALYLTQRQH
ncbi:polyprenyl synthetase family protein [Flavisolibacter ginsengisoli]|jgi:geranylgeranyl diphosphate synthase type II|uniref:Geranylgeranyl diphosphate synthase, type II n=1 Tax=Flavisolibacter ginsengisoli DSM 18119 TaxID=1121884 RepID=A0A1M4YRW3_9BACT|nr:polyprenyl synthetase family protein [Flavisolibacter ginsengisoli]SHF08520.1 geranylgeranyl diphosphate synthase, type II [Flavisolibacter ginsengisoli DSM 18119]